MRILVLIFLIVSSFVSDYRFSVKSVFLTSDIVDSIFQTLEISSEEYSDSILAKKLADKIFDFFESKGIIDPEILISFGVSGEGKIVSIEVLNERVTHINDVKLKRGDTELKSTFFKRHLLQNDIFLKFRFEEGMKFLQDLGLFPYAGYSFEKSPFGYDLVLKYNNFSAFPVFFVNYSNQLTNLFFFYDGLTISTIPLKYRIGFNLAGRAITNAQLQIKFPLSLSLKFFGTLAIIHDSITLEKLSFGRKWEDFTFSAGFSLMSLNFESLSFSFILDKKSLDAGVLARLGLNSANLFVASTACFFSDPGIGYSFVYSHKDVVIPSYSGVNRIKGNNIFVEAFADYKSFVLSRVFGECGAWGLGFKRAFQNRRFFVVVSKKDKLPLLDGAMITLFVFERVPLLDFMPDFN